MAKKSELLFVDETKKRRAEDIVLLVFGKKAPKDESEVTLKAKFSDLLKEAGVSASDSLEFVYEKLGGLLRTHEEADEIEEDSKPKGKGKGKKDDDDEIEED